MDHFYLTKCQVKLKETVEAALQFRPHVVVTVDSKGFSFRLLKQLWGNITNVLELGSIFCVFAYCLCNIMCRNIRNVYFLQLDTINKGQIDQYIFIM